MRFNDYWGRWTQTGVHGDATKATAEKGRILFEAAVTGLVELVDELRAWPIDERQDMHRRRSSRRFGGECQGTPIHTGLGDTNRYGFWGEREGSREAYFRRKLPSIRRREVAAKVRLEGRPCRFYRQVGVM